METDIESYTRVLRNKKRKDTIENIGHLLFPFDRWLNLNGYQLSEIDDKEVTEYCNHKIKRKEWIPDSANQFISILKKYFKWRAARIEPGVSTEDLRRTLQERQRAERIIGMNRYVTEERERTKGLTIDKIAELFDVVESTPDYPKVVSIFYFGWRRKEQASLDPQNHKQGIAELSPAKVDFRNRRIRLMTGKSYVLRTLYFSTEMGRILKQGMNDNSFRINEDVREINWMLERYDKDMGLHLYPKMGRESFDTHMRPLLRDDILLKIILGHKVRKSDMTARYADWNEEIKTAMQQKHYLNPYFNEVK